MNKSGAHSLTSYFCLLTSVLCLLTVLMDPVFAMSKRPPVSPKTLAVGAGLVPAQSGDSGRPQGAPLLTLEECYVLALEHSETVLLEKEDIETAEAQFFKATSEALGDVDFEMNFSRQEELVSGDTGSVSRSFTDPAKRERKFVISQPIFRGFKALGALMGAGSLRKEQKEEWIRAKELLFLDVANAFNGLLHQKEDLEIIEGIYRLYRSRIRELAARERIGRSRPSEVASAKTRMKILEAERARVHAAHALAQDLLEFLTGIEVKERELIEEELPSESISELEAYLEMAPERSDVEAAKQAMKTAKQGVVVAQSELWPEITLEHNQYNRREGLQADIDWDLLFKVNVPLFRGGETVGKIKEAVSEWKKEKLNYSYAKRSASLEVKQAYRTWISSTEENKALQEALEAAEENFFLQREEYRRNLVSNLDVLEALESLHETRRDANRTHYQMKENYWNLRIAAGEDEDSSLRGVPQGRRSNLKSGIASPRSAGLAMTDKDPI